MDAELQRLEELKETLSKYKEELTSLNGRKTQLLTSLKKDFKVSSLKSTKNLLKEKKEEIKQKKKELASRIDKLEKELEKHGI